MDERLEILIMDYLSDKLSVSDQQEWDKEVAAGNIKPEDIKAYQALMSGMENIKVVPNPYVMTNMMEEAVTNPYLNQRRKLLFTHIPAECTIKIFTVSGVLVDEIKVQNKPEQGIVHWDMLTRESLEIAAGMYIYHVESVVTGDSKLGKFAVIK